jgi:hypothetical protein
MIYALKMKAIKMKAMGRNKFQAAINLDPSCVMNDKKKMMQHISSHRNNR